MNNELPAEISRAYSLLRDVKARPGAEARIYRNVVARPRHRKRLGLGVAISAFGLVVVASAAYALGLVTQTPKTPTPLHLTPSSSAPSPKPKQATTTFSENVNSKDDASLQTTVVPSSVTPSDVIAVRPNAKARGAASASDRTSTMAPRSELSQQVAAYREAVAQLGSNPGQALVLFRLHRQNWPQSAIRPEVELRIVQTLVALGHNSEAKQAARRYLERYPESVRAPELKRIAGF